MAVPVHGLPSLLHTGMKLAVVPPPLKETRWRTVKEVSGEDERGSLIRLSGCDDLGAAEALVGKTLLADVSDLPADYERYDIDALLGRSVIDEAMGCSGMITEVLRGPANDVWEVLFQDDAFKTSYLLPVIDEVVLDLPHDGVIRVRVPEGLEPESRVPRSMEHMTDGDVPDAL